MSTEEPIMNGGITNLSFEGVITDTTKDSNGGGSIEEPVINEGIDNLNFEDVITDTKDRSGSSGARFRISRLNTQEELLESPNQLDTTPEVSEENSDSVQSKPDGGKRIQLNIPSDYKDSTDQRNSTLIYPTQTLGYLTHDAVPLSVFYRNEASRENSLGGDTRPTLEQLHKGEGLENAKKRHWVSGFFFKLTATLIM